MRFSAMMLPFAFDRFQEFERARHAVFIAIILPSFARRFSFRFSERRRFRFYAYADIIFIRLLIRFSPFSSDLRR